MDWYVMMSTQAQSDFRMDTFGWVVIFSVLGVALIGWLMERKL